MERCLTRIAPWVERIVVIDSFSTDADGRDRARAGRRGAANIPSRTTPTSFAGAWRPPGADDGMGDADRLRRIFRGERLGRARRAAADLPADVTGVNVKRKLIFREQWIQPRPLLSRHPAAPLAQRRGRDGAALDGRAHGAHARARGVAGRRRSRRPQSRRPRRLDRQAQPLRDAGDGRRYQPRVSAVRGGPRGSRRPPAPRGAIAS